MIWYLDEVVKSLVLILPKISGYAKTCKDKDQNKDNKLMSFCIDIGEGIDVAKSNKSNECMVRHYYIFNCGFKFQNFQWLPWFDNIVSYISNVAIIVVKGVN